MSKIKENNKIYKTIKIEFIPDKETETFLKDNCSYRHFLYNKCVEMVKHIQENDPNGHIGTMSKYELITLIREGYEKSYSATEKPGYLKDYDYYFRGISECVLDDIYTTIERIITERVSGNSSDIRFMKYNPNKLSFRFKNKIDKRRPKRPDGLYGNNSIILTDNPYIIGIKINNTYDYPLGIHLRESIDKFNLNLNNVREIAFKFHNEKWHLCLIMDCTDETNKYTKCVDVIYRRKEVAGIDLGETNPVVLYDGKRVVSIPKHLQYPKDRVAKVEVRVKRLQRVLDQKYNPDVDRFHQSKNYYKVLKKFHKAWEHLYNIKKDWHFKLSHWIVTHYKNIVVDDFRDHIIRINHEMTNKIRQNMNRGMQNKSIHNFTQRLIHMCAKYGTNYFKPITEETTNTYSKCGNVNEIKLTYDEKYKREDIFKCECCGYTIDRDINASINCYNDFNFIKEIL